MDLTIARLQNPVKLCVICQCTEESCQREGPHIFDSITYLWAVMDDYEQPISFHVNEAGAKVALSRYHA